LARPSTGPSSPPRALPISTKRAPGRPGSCIGTNFDHRHSGIRYVSPAQRHAGAGRATPESGRPSAPSRSTPNATASSRRVRLATIFSRWLHDSGDNSSTRAGSCRGPGRRCRVPRSVPGRSPIRPCQRRRRAGSSRCAGRSRRRALRAVRGAASAAEKTRSDQAVQPTLEHHRIGPRLAFSSEQYTRGRSGKPAAPPREGLDWARCGLIYCCQYFSKPRAPPAYPVEMLPSVSRRWPMSATPLLSKPALRRRKIGDGFSHSIEQTKRLVEEGA